MRARILSGVLALLAVLALAAPAPAATPEALALQQLQGAQKAARTALRQALAVASSGAIAEIAALEQSLDAAVALTAPDALFDVLETFQLQVEAALADAGNAQANAARDALATLGDTLQGVYPSGFYPGDGSPTAAFEEAVAKDLAKTYGKLRKRLKRTAALFGESGVGLSFRLAPPRPFPLRNWTESLVDAIVLHASGIDVALAWSALGSTGDGQLRVAGRADVSAILGFGDVTLSAALPGGIAVLDAMATPASGRFASDFGGAPVAEGVWLVTSNQGSLLGAEITIGVR